ncbi:exodeoxyribonuclease III [Haloglycomyces albus]|uniref:exodeoxyribonuclease III n=1 Tax=Haloglycomyces albus TaxID=526067 RepID=UPI00046CD182|nr:exodeoxyribonuclease III [Haloglycomyces albus]
MRIATWNVNSINARIDRVHAWLSANDCDVLCLQELKCATDDVPVESLRELGYEVAAHGTGRWNGVAIISRVGLDDVQRNLPRQPTFKDEIEPRAIAATCGPLRIWSVYVPNGRDVDDPHYRYKLDFLQTLGEVVVDDERPFAITGDMNVCPTDDDVWDRSEWKGTTHVSEPERAALADITGHGLTDIIPRALKHGKPFTFWDYRNLDFPKNRGLRIDLILANEALRTAVTDVYVDRNERKGKGASDHAPVVAEVNV